jgi:hypothetical protein
MQRWKLLVLALLAAPLAVSAQTQDWKATLDTIAVEAEGVYEADPDLATLTFQVFAEEKELRRAYEKATQALERITELAERNRIAKSDISAGVFTSTPLYEGKRKPRAYRVQTVVTVKVRDLSRVGFLVDDAVESGVAEFRSASYSLADEEAAKQRAVAEAMRRAQRRARTAVEETQRRLGQLRQANIDIKMDIRNIQWGAWGLDSTAFLTAGLARGSRGRATPQSAPSPPYSEVAPEKIKITATARCIFQIQ